VWECRLAKGVTRILATKIMGVTHCGVAYTIGEAWHIISLD
jgi:hypothetical protein